MLSEIWLLGWHGDDDDKMKVIGGCSISFNMNGELGLNVVLIVISI